MQPVSIASRHGLAHADLDCKSVHAYSSTVESVDRDNDDDDDDDDVCFIVSDQLGALRQQHAECH